MSVFCEAAELPSNLKTITKMENKTGLEKLLDSLVHQSNGCGQGSERYILSGIIDYTKELIEKENKEGKKYNGNEVAGMMKASYKAGCRIDLKKLQSVLHNSQQVMAGYSQDDTWSDYDRQSHSELIEMQYIVEAEINNVQPIKERECGKGQNIA